MSTKNYTSLAKEAWNEAAPIHWKTTQSYIEAFKSPETSFLTPLHRAELDRIGLIGRSVAQFNCNNGRELISIIRQGADSGVGFDISEEFVAQGRELAKAADANCEFVATDIYEIPQSYDGSFDMIVVTSGALCFMPDLKRYFETARRLLRPDGILNVYDCHPITDMIPLDRDRETNEIVFTKSYFDSEPSLHSSGLDYVNGTTYDAKGIYYFHYTLAEILQTVIDTDFSIQRIMETEEDPSGAYPSIETQKIKPPLSFMLTAVLS